MGVVQEYCVKVCCGSVWVKECWKEEKEKCMVG